MKEVNDKRLVSKLNKHTTQLCINKPSNPVRKWSEDLNRLLPKIDKQIPQKYMM